MPPGTMMVNAERQVDQTADRSKWIDTAAFLIVLAVAIAIAAAMWISYERAPDQLWRGFYHDRNSHYSFGLDLALAARNLDPAWFFGELEKAKVWPPFHGLVLSAVLLVGGIDYRLAIVPSLIGWVMTLAFVWLIARRMVTNRIEGLFAAAIATVLTASSPAFRLISADVMLEGLGAGLSAAALWTYLRASEEPGRASHWRLLAVLLTVLFFHKGNYWGLLLIPIGIAFASERSHGTMQLAREIGRIKIGPLVGAVLRQPLLILAALIAALIAAIYARGPTALELFGKSVSLYPPENLTTLAYALVFLWWSLFWWRNKAAIDAALGVPGRALLYWHLTPIAISFLLPHRLSRFLWFVGPANSPQGNTGVWEGAQFYWRVFNESYHVTPWMAVPVAALALIGALGLPRLAPGARVVFLFAAIAWLGVVIHPQHQGRFMSTWVFAVWICSGVGCAMLLHRLRRTLSLWVRGLVAAAAVASLLAVVIGRPLPAVAYTAAIRATEGPTDLDLIRPYLPELDGSREVAVFTTFGTSKLFAWVTREHCRCNRVVDDPFIDRQPSREDVRELMRDRIARSTADVVVIIDAPDSRYSLPLLGWDYARMAGIVDAMADQTRYKRTATYDLPDQQGRATIWRRS
ncbi:glycosyltransferase family 39 protein [Rhodopseudomonas sp. HC1]|uniref:glycosyltransferase family 39 protein n=1 Tax=Rhodopseudomonas infernalis TaxID=2897386 RepID=UPI001EE87869|nr:glycosyltransferase family 39 protein [Rhodopseudomonas infernalis]MCG6205048.1 glycosyltransferase family 39 protein [Rhodopseudomonas infernalis]